MDVMIQWGSLGITRENKGTMRLIMKCSMVQKSLKHISRLLVLKVLRCQKLKCQR